MQFLQQVHGRKEVKEFVTLASALLINIGTLDEEWVESMCIAADMVSKTC